MNNPVKDDFYVIIILIVDSEYCHVLWGQYRFYSCNNCIVYKSDIAQLQNLDLSYIPSLIMFFLVNNFIVVSVT